MTEPVFRSDVTVHLVDYMGDENSIVRRARVSTGGPFASERNNPGDELSQADLGLLRMLYRDKHGVPFEGVEFEFYFEVPVFVSRQLVKHRLSSINEASGRYREMEGQFWVVPENAQVEQIGKTSAYEFTTTDPNLVNLLRKTQRDTATRAWEDYEYLLERGIAKQYAREHLPLTLFSQMYYKANLRSILNFLSLRKEWGDESAYPSHPQYEITLVADKVADEVKDLVPHVYEEFLKGGMRPV